MKARTTTRRSCDWLELRGRGWWNLCIAIVLTGHLATVATADDRPTIMLSQHNLHPTTIDVHVGEIVTWRSATDDRIELRFDLHPSAHEVISQANEVKGFFRRAGEHTYSGKLKDGRAFIGVVRVREPDGTVVPPITNQCDLSRTLCIMP